MKMIASYYLTGILFLFSMSLLQAQTEEVTVNMIESGQSLNNVVMIGKKVPEGGVIGDQFLFPDSKEGKIVFANSRYIDKVKINYDAYERLVYFSVEDYKRMIEPENIKNFEIGSSLYEPFEYEGKTQIGQRIHSSSNVTIFESAEVILKEPTYNPALDMGSRDYIYKQKTLFFIQVKQGDFYKIKSSSNKNIKVLDVDGLKGFVKENSLSWNKINDLQRIASFIESSF